mgnify:CR=1 FL=1
MLADQLVLKRIGYDPERTIVATIGLLYVIQQVTLMTYGPDARPVEAPFNHRLSIPFVEWTEGGFALYWPWGLGTTSYKLAVIGAAVILLTAIWLLMTRTRYGLLMRATQLDRETAQAFAIPVGRVYASVFGLGAGLAALGGVLIVPDPAGALPDGARPAAAVFHRGHHRRPRQPSRHCRRGAADRLSLIHI